MDLSTNIAGVPFRLGIMNASGALCVTQAELEALGESAAGAIVTKSMTPLPREGNPHPRYVAIEGGSINSMGLPNLGYPAYAKLIPELKRFKKPVIASLAGLHPDDFLAGAKALNAAGPDLIEVNLSCPNIPGKPQIGYDFEETERLLSAIRDIVTIPFGVKLPPYFDPIHHQKIAEILQRIGVAVCHYDQFRGEYPGRGSGTGNGGDQTQGGIWRAWWANHQTCGPGQCSSFVEDLGRSNPDYWDRRRRKRDRYF